MCSRIPIRRTGIGRCRGASGFVRAALACAIFLAAAPSHAAPPDPAGGDPASGAITFYQKYISSLRHARCPFDPSCSQYALEAIRSHGPLAGSTLSTDRLMRCNESVPSFYARGPDGRYLDPVDTERPPRHAPQVPGWLVAVPADAPPEGPGAAEMPPDAAVNADFARELARAGDCERATTEYLRAAHTAGTPQLQFWARLQAGTCFFGMEEWTLAQTEFLRARRLARSPADEGTTRRLAAACRFNAGDFAGSEALLREGPPEWSADSGPALPIGSAAAPAGDAGAATAPESDRVRGLALLGVCAMARGHWDSARVHFERGFEISAGSVHPAKLRYLTAACAAGEQLPSKSPGLAATMSAVVPGSGQVYAGRVLDGLRHLLFNGVLIYSVVKLAVEEHYPAAVLVGGLELPFYVGNIRGARGSARAFNSAHRMDFVAGALAQTED